MIKHYAKMDPDTNTVLTSVVGEGDNDLDIRTKLEKSTGWLKENWIAHPESDQEAELHIRIGSTYNSETGKFLRPKPYTSWTLKADGTDWEAPVANPDNLPEQHWDEDNQEWRPYSTE
jgi:hypothetical protein